MINFGSIALDNSIDPGPLGIVKQLATFLSCQGYATDEVEIAGKSYTLIGQPNPSGVGLPDKTVKQNTIRDFRVSDMSARALKAILDKVIIIYESNSDATLTSTERVNVAKNDLTKFLSSQV